MISKRIFFLLYLKGGIFPENSEHLVNAFQSAARILNTSNELLKLQTTVISVDTNDSFKVQKAGICSYFIIRNLKAITKI